MALLAACALLVGCGDAEPTSTACPVPSLPEPTATACPIPSLPQSTTPLTGATDNPDAICGGESLSAPEAYALLQDATADITVIDTRTPAEFESGHIPGAVNISTQDAAFWDRMGELSSTDAYLLYCRTGSTTRRVVEQMLAQGFTNVCHIGDGFNAWKSEGLPVEEGSS